MSVKRNFLYNGILTASGYVFTLLTYPYVSRVLGLSNVGIVNFVDGLINYFILFAMMGIGTVGIREVAIHKGDKARLSRTFSGILLLNAISTLTVAAVLLAAMYLVPALFPYRDLLYIGECKLLFNLLLAEWFFTGMENFAYVTKRTIVIKLVYVACVFLFIRDASDYLLYYLLCVLMVVANGLVNIVYCRRFVRPTLKGIALKPYLGTFFSIGFYVIIGSMYTSLNIAWLGFASGTDEVGYYTTATKLHTIILALLMAFQNVMFPRVTSLLAEGNTEEYKAKVSLSIDSLLAFSIPVIIVCVIFGPNILHLLVGDGYEGSYLPFRIIMPLILIIGYEQITCIQILMAMKQDRRLLFNSCLGAASGLVLNMLLVGRLGAVGSSLVWLLSELVIMARAQYWVGKVSNFTFPWRPLSRYILAYLPVILLLMVIHQALYLSDVEVIVIVAIVIAAYTTAVQLTILRNPVFMLLLTKLRITKR
jgi:O-antigen/teichoic acid export membrane protein